MSDEQIWHLSSDRLLPLKSVLITDFNNYAVYERTRDLHVKLILEQTVDFCDNFKTVIEK